MKELESLRDAVLTDPSATARYASLRMPSVGMTWGGEVGICGFLWFWVAEMGVFRYNGVRWTLLAGG